MSEVHKHLDLLGMTVKDKVTQIRGVVTSVSFDLYGSIQAAVTMNDSVSYWYDITRLDITMGERVMPVPNFSQGYIAKGLKGPADKPINGGWSYHEK